MTATIEAQIKDHLNATGASRCRRLFSIEQAARNAGVPLEIILRWIRTGRLELYRVRGGQLRIDEVELDECLASFEWRPCPPRS